MLAVGTIVGSAAGQDDALNGGLAAPAGLTRPLVDTVLHLEKAALAVGADVVGDR